jgi:hypothetical protein
VPVSPGSTPIRPVLTRSMSIRSAKSCGRGKVPKRVPVPGGRCVGWIRPGQTGGSVSSAHRPGGLQRPLSLRLEAKTASSSRFAHRSWRTQAFRLMKLDGLIDGALIRPSLERWVPMLTDLGDPP